MSRKGSFAKSSLRHILFIGLCFAILGGLLHTFFDASPERTVSTSVLILLGAYVIWLLLKGRRLEEALIKYQAGMDASVDGMAIFNGRFQALYINNAFARLYGYDSHKDLLGKAWNIFYPHAHKSLLHDEIAPILAGKGRWRGEAFGRKRDGSVFPEEVSLTRMSGDGIVCIVRDITEQKENREKLERQALELAASNKELEAFAYSLSHDLRTHLTRSSSALQLMDDHDPGNGADFARYLLSVISQANADMEELVEAMLTLSKASRKEVTLQKVPLSEIAQGVASTLALSDPGRSVSFVVAPDVVATGDPQLLKIALQNLLGNAWKFTRGVSDARIEFGMQKEEDRIVFFVRDNGIGFAKADAERLFEPFQRLDNARAFPGTGIGLATVQRVMLRHAGKVWGEGDPGKGATFFFTLRC